MPSKTLLLALTLDTILGTILATVGIPGLAPVPFPMTLFVFAYAFVFALLVNDLVKFAIFARTGSRATNDKGTLQHVSAS